MGENSVLGLYATLQNNISHEPLDDNEKKILLDVNSLDEKEHLAISQLIKTHHSKEMDLDYSIIDSENVKAPYGGIQDQGNTSFYIDQLPVELCRIIIKFLMIIKKNTDDS